ncbi:MAG TPA: winged helix-turn-helix domain-containing protein [Mycobacteriales bacterium]|nr:winged helix-turn-helix domain-containing protein [Mycobacteriales bacterium]
MSFAPRGAPVLRDPRAMRALAHPARLAILERLSADGPATATECAEVTGQSPSACSYHLRALARWGLVTQADGRDRRERRWAVVGPFVIGDHDAPREAAVAAAEHALTGQVLARASERVLAWMDRSDGESPEWREATLVANRSLVLTADELTRLLEQVDRLCEPFVASRRRESAPADARVVRLHLSAVPDPP